MTNPGAPRAAPIQVTALVSAPGWYAVLASDPDHPTLPPLVGWALGTVSNTVRVVGLIVGEDGLVQSAEDDSRFAGYWCTRAWPDK